MGDQPASTSTDRSDSRPVASTSGGSQRDDSQKKIGEKTGSCVPHFDALWFCYSPVHQMKEYYRYGNVDDCTGHWGKLMDCLKLKTERYKASVPEDLGAGKHPLWELRTPQEASEFWQAEFGHLQKQPPGGGAAAPGGAAEAEPPLPSRSEGMV